MMAVIYARYSPGPNQTEASIEGQVKEIEAYAERNGYTIIEKYIDRALTGKTEDRPSFLRMVADSNAKHFQYILVYQLDRFARNKYDSVVYKRKLKKNGVRVISVRENITDDASGILMESVLEGMAEYYSAELSQKIKRGLDLNADKGYVTGNSGGLGYKSVRIDPTDEKSKKKHIIDEEAAKIVRRIFRMYTDGISVTDITDQLNAEGCKTSTGAKFNKNSLRTMLQNKRYIGITTYKGIERPDETLRIVSDEIFYKAEGILDNNRKAPAKTKAKIEYLLTHKLYCGHCKDNGREEMMTGFSGTGRNGGVYRYYTCNGAKPRRKDDKTKERIKLCKKKMVGKDYIEDLVIAECRRQLDDMNIDKIAKSIVATVEAEIDTTNIKQLRKALAENERKHSNLMDAIMECDVESLRKSLYKKAPELEQERKRIEREIAQEEKVYPTLTVSKIKFFLTSLKKGNMNDIKYRKTLISVFVNKIYLYDDRVTFIFNSGDTPVTISDQLLSKIESGQKQKSFCFCPDEVEARRVELLSEDPSTKTSPITAGFLVSPVPQKAGKLRRG